MGGKVFDGQTLLILDCDKLCTVTKQTKQPWYHACSHDQRLMRYNYLTLSVLFLPAVDEDEFLDIFVFDVEDDTPPFLDATDVFDTPFFDDDEDDGEGEILPLDNVLFTCLDVDDDEVVLDDNDWLLLFDGDVFTFADEASVPLIKDEVAFVDDEVLLVSFDEVLPISLGDVLFTSFGAVWPISRGDVLGISFAVLPISLGDVLGVGVSFCVTLESVCNAFGASLCDVVAISPGEVLGATALFSGKPNDPLELVSCLH